MADRTNNAAPKPSGKSPYEIRLDVLKMAQDMLKLEHESALADYYRKSELPTTAVALPPHPPSTDDVIARASILYDFVSNNKPSTK